MKVIPLRNLLISGRHGAALTEVEVDEACGHTLLAQRLAALPKPAGGATSAQARAARSREIEAATAAPPLAEVAVMSAPAAKPKAPKRKSAQ